MKNDTTAEIIYMGISKVTVEKRKTIVDGKQIVKDGSYKLILPKIVAKSLNLSGEMKVRVVLTVNGEICITKVV